MKTVALKEHRNVILYLQELKKKRGLAIKAVSLYLVRGHTYSHQCFRHDVTLTLLYASGCLFEENFITIDDKERKLMMRPY